jgi:transmembrane sensor
MADRFMPAPDIEAEASEWLIRLERGPSPALQAEFEQWIAAQPRRRAMFMRLQRTWRHADILSKLRPLDGAVDANLMNSFGLCGPVSMTGRKKHRLAWLVGAASVLVLVTGAVIWMAAVRSEWQTYETEQGGFQRIALPDGSLAFLNTNSEIRVKLTRTSRQVVLARGEALFTVAHDVHRPFDVTAADTVVRAVGTAFSVRLGAERRVDVLVTEGRVAIDPPEGSAKSEPAQQVTLPKSSTLDAGESVSVTARRMNVHKMAAEDMTRKLAWTHVSPHSSLSTSELLERSASRAKP